ncbi:MAG: hypothetical protein CMH54_12620 [Myxococcales bacterium]|nr:hypothetical protein [Myxococcales bacterium]|tara:strand:+ start:2226 stop:2582 length:357 start_codon:yes stop_codon:yes gene_type:complete
MTSENIAPFGVLAHHPISTARGIEVLNQVKEWLRSQKPGFQCWAVSDPVDAVCAELQNLPEETTVHIVPLLLFPGQHYQGEVHALCARIQELRPDLNVVVKPSLLETPGFLDGLFRDL